MASNHLPGGADLTSFGRPLFSETAFDGVGFGLGVSVTLDPIAAKVPGSPGDFAWGGAASTAFWVDPAEALTAMFFTQLWPSSTHPIRSQLKQLVYQALVEPASRVRSARQVSWKHSDGWSPDPTGEDRATSHI